MQLMPVSLNVFLNFTVVIETIKRIISMCLKGILILLHKYIVLYTCIILYIS